MIAKQVAMQSVKKSDFASLVKYITDTQNKNERVGCVSITNCQVDQGEQVDAAILEVLNTQAQNTRARSDRTYHLVVSFRAGEQPRQSSLKAIEARLCAALGYGDHQRVSAVHHDTDNLHVHIAINKIHPSRYTLHEPYNDYKTLGQVCEKLEIEFGLAQDNHQAHQAHQRAAQSRAVDMEHHAGVESLLGWIQRECRDPLQAAQSWAELHQAMQAKGLALRERGNGLVFTAQDGTTVKASSVARDYSKRQLEVRLGPFEPCAERSCTSSPGQACTSAPEHPFLEPSSLVPPATTYARQPMRSGIDTAPMYARYQAEQQAGKVLRRDEWARAIDRKTRLIEAAKRSGRLKRAAIQLIKLAGPGKKILYAATRKTLKDDLQAISQQYLKERQQIYAKHRRLAWADWLRVQASEGDPQALGALRARAAAQGLQGNTVSGRPGPNPLQVENPDKSAATPDSITKQGTIIYRVGLTAVRDDGKQLQVSRGASPEGLQAALQMARVRYGARLTVNGTAAFKERIAQAAASAQLPITFDDAALERRRQALLPIITPQENAHEPEKARSHRAKSDTGQNREGAGAGGEAGKGKGKRADAGRTDSRCPAGAGVAPARDSAGARRPTGHAGPTLAGAVAPAVRGGAGAGGGRGAGRGTGSLPGKPNVGRVGRQPPPQSQNCLRGLSELGVVHLGGRGEVLLPGDVPGHLEQPRAQPDHGLRRSVSRPGALSAYKTATAHDLTERDTKRLKKMDIPNHKHYTAQHAGMVVFAGMRHTGEQTLALLQSGDDVLVLAIDEATARRLKRVAVGSAIRVTSQGVLRTKGRSR